MVQGRETKAVGSSRESEKRNGGEVEHFMLFRHVASAWQEAEDRLMPGTLHYADRCVSANHGCAVPVSYFVIQR
jgi:hypothetical protein